MAVRRIKNNLSASTSNGSRSVEGKRNSLVDWSSSNSTTLQRKQYNSDTTRSSYHSYPRPTPEILPSYTGSPHTHLRKRIQRQPEVGQSNDATARTRHWVNHHNQMGWGGEEETPREISGSIWASRNREPMQQRVQQKERKEKPRRLSKTRQQLLTSSLPPSEPVRELFSSFQSPTARSSIPELPEGSNMTSRSSQSSARRKVSYAAAMENRLYEASTSRHPVRERHSDGTIESRSERHIERPSDRRSTPEWYNQSRNFEDSREFETGGYHQHPASTTAYRQRSSWRRGYAEDREEDAMMRELSGLPVYSYLRKSGGNHVSPYGNPQRDERLPNPSAYPPQIESYL